LYAYLDLNLIKLIKLIKPGVVFDGLISLIKIIYNCFISFPFLQCDCFCSRCNCNCSCLMETFGFLHCL